MKLVREGIIEQLREDQFVRIDYIEQLNELYVAKVNEELLEVVNSNFNDITEFGDLIEVVLCFAESNGFAQSLVMEQVARKLVTKGKFTNGALTDLNPNNPSNAPYLDNEEEVD